MCIIWIQAILELDHEFPALIDIFESFTDLLDSNDPLIENENDREQIIDILQKIESKQETQEQTGQDSLNDRESYSDQEQEGTDHHLQKEEEKLA